MSRQLQHPRDLVATPAQVAASTTVAATGRAACGGDAVDVRMFGDVAPEVRLRMELLARASASPATALPHVVALLVEGDEQRAAIVEAISGNEPLREQWNRTWEVLRR
jgi:hypothetical protein